MIDPAKKSVSATSEGEMSELRARAAALACDPEWRRRRREREVAEEVQEAKFREEELARFDGGEILAEVAHILEWVASGAPRFRLRPRPETEAQAIDGYQQAFGEDDELCDQVFASKMEAFNAGFVFGEVMRRLNEVAGDD